MEMLLVAKPCRSGPHRTALEVENEPADGHAFEPEKGVRWTRPRVIACLRMVGPEYLSWRPPGTSQEAVVARATAKFESRCDGSQPLCARVASESTVQTVTVRGHGRYE